MRQIQISFSYWSTMILTLLRPRYAEQHIDIELGEAILRARWYSAWSSLIIAVWLLAERFGLWKTWLQHATGISSPLWQWAVTVAAVVIALPVAYGAYRLYILLTHIVSVNVFKVRGQRLRLLNLQTTLLTLTAPTVIGLVTVRFSASLGNLILAICIIYAAWILARGYNQIFHKKQFGGFLLFVEAALVTAFITAMGGIAFAAAIGVLGFFLLLILRSFMH